LGAFIATKGILEDLNYCEKFKIPFGIKNRSLIV